MVSFALRVARSRRTMRNKMHQVSESATGDQKLAEFATDKRGYARRWRGSPRWVDGLLAQGLPHIKTSPRRVRIVVADAGAWMREQFGCQRRGKLNGGSAVTKRNAEPPLESSRQ